METHGPTPDSFVAARRLGAGAPGPRADFDPGQDLFNLVPQPAWVFHRETLRFLAVNEAATAKYGYSREEFLSMTAKDIRPAQEVPALLEHVETMRQTPVGPEGDWIHQAKDGRTFEVEIFRRPIGFRGEPAELIVAVDIRKRRRAQENLSLRYSVTRILGECATDCVPQVLALLGRSLRFTLAELWLVNSKYSAISRAACWLNPNLVRPNPAGTEPACDSQLVVPNFSLPGMKWITDFSEHPLTSSRSADLVGIGVRGAIGIPVRSQTSTLGILLLFGDTSKTPSADTLELISDLGLQLGLRLERERATAQAKRTELEFRSLFDDCPVPYHEIDSLGNVARVNRAECEILGKAADEIIGRPVWELVSPSERESSRTSIQRTLRSAQTEPLYERRYRGADGGERVFEVHERVLANDSGGADGIRTAMLDVSGIGRAQEKIAFQAGVLDRVNEAIIACDLRCRIQYWNKTAELLFGWTAEEALGRDLSEIVVSDTAPWKNGLLEWNWELHTSACHELICQLRDGRQAIIEAAISSLQDSLGKVDGAVMIYRDVTERRNIEACLKASEERFRIALENSADLVFETDLLTGDIRVFHGVAIRHRHFLEHRPRTLAELAALIHPDDRPRVERQRREHTLRSEAYSTEFRIVLPNGEVRHLSVRGGPMRDPSGVPRKWVGAIQDVTEVKAAERADAARAAIVESLEAAVVSLDLDGNIITWNPGAERMYGYPGGEMIGRSVMSLIPDELKSREQKILAASRRGKCIRHMESVRITKAGSKIDIALTTSPIRDSAGTIIGMARVTTDITERKRLQQQLAQTQKLESIGRLASGIAHEINTPIQYIGDNAKFLQESFQDLIRCIDGSAGAADVDLEYLRDEIPSSIQQLSEGVNRVAQIVKAMKEFSHPGQVDKAPADLNRAIESTALVSRNEWKYVADLTVDLDPNLPAVPLILGEFNQVLLNLIVNAAHSIETKVNGTGQKGTIIIKTRRQAEGVEIRVSDSGTGIPKSVQPKIFDPFFTTKGIGKGTGQGLSIAHSVIVQKHRGVIRFETEEGVGTTFIIQLPVEGKNPDEAPDLC
jgi:PAS domain S-box-containing protein